MTLDDWLKSIGYTGSERGGIVSLYPEDVSKLRALFLDAKHGTNNGVRAKISATLYEAWKLKEFLHRANVTAPPGSVVDYCHGISEDIYRRLGEVVDAP